MIYIFVIPAAIIGILSGSPLVAIIFGAGCSILLKIPKNLISSSISTRLLNVGIITLAFSISSDSLISLSTNYFIIILIFVVSTFLMGLMLTKFLKIEKNIGILIASGSAICGATAMIVISSMIKIKPNQFLSLISIFFIFNFLSILILPLIGSYFYMSSEEFGAWIAMGIHDTGSVIGAAIAFDNLAIETAATIKLLRTLWLLPLIVFISIFFSKDQNAKLNFIIIVIAFLSIIFLSSLVQFDQQFIYAMKYISKIAFLLALFFIGTQIDLSAMRQINSNVFLHATSLWAFALIFSFILINFF